MAKFVSMFSNLKLMKNYLSFVLTLISIVGSLLLGWFKGISLDALLPSLLGIYVLGRVVEKGNVVWAASKDPNANVENTIYKTYK